MEQYQLLKLFDEKEHPYVLRLSDGAYVHRELNTEYTKWLEEGNTPLPADE
jgi:hypothetical protein